MSILVFSGKNIGMILMIRDPIEMILMLEDLKWLDPQVLVAPLAEVTAAQVMIAGPMNKPQGQVLWQYGLWSFQTKIERCLDKNQHSQRKLLNFEFWINDELSKSAKI